MKIYTLMTFCAFFMINSSILLAENKVSAIQPSDIPRRVDINDPRYSEQLKKFESKFIRSNHWKVPAPKKIVIQPLDPRPLTIKRKVKQTKIVNTTPFFRFRQVDHNKLENASQNQTTNVVEQVSKELSRDIAPSTTINGNAQSFKPKQKPAKSHHVVNNPDRTMKKEIK